MPAVEATAWDAFTSANPIFDFGDFAPTTGRSLDAGGGTTGGSVVAGFTASTSAGEGFVAVALSAVGVVVVVAAAGVVGVVAGDRCRRADLLPPGRQPRGGSASWLMSSRSNGFLASVPSRF